MTKPARKKALGKGLQALIPQLNTIEVYEEEVKEDRIRNIDINKIFPNKQQPRKDFNKESLQELSESIKTHGLIQPIVVAEEKEGFIIVAGERRWRAARAANLKEIPCIVKKYKQQNLMEIALIENIQREDLNIVEEASAYKYIIDTYQVTQEQLGVAIGKSRSYIANILRLLQLDNRVIEMIKEGKISAGHGRALLSINSDDKQYEMAKRIVEKQLNVRQVEELMRNLLNSKKKEKKKKEKDFMITKFEEDLKSYFGTKVNITRGRKKGKIEIEYYNDGDLERILALLHTNN